MSDTEPDNVDSRRTDDEAGIARVLRAAGGRPKPSDEMTAAVRAAVHAEWRASVGERDHSHVAHEARGVASRRRVGLALAASVVVAALALWVGRSYLVAPGELVASVNRSIGTVESRSGAFGSWHSAETQVHANEDVRTGSDGRVALQLRDGVSLRLDHNTVVAFVDAGRVDVTSGAVYVDAGPVTSTSEHLRLGTPAGVAQHVGTQYEARIVEGGTRISVREGRVDLRSTRGDVQSTGMGEQLLVSSTGEVRRNSISPQDVQWNWAAETAPTFDINGRTMRDFLTWVGRELGREIVFADAASEAEASKAVLSGSVAGLTPADALAAVLPTTQLRSTERDGKLEISLQ